MKSRALTLAAAALFFLAQWGCAKKDQVKQTAADREWVLSALGSIEGPEGEKVFMEVVKRGGELFPVIAGALEHEDDDVAEAAAGVLGEMKDKRAVPHLVRYLKSGRNRRYAAAWALGEIGDPSSVFPLIDALEDENAGVVKSTTRAITKLGEKTVPVLIDSLESGSVRKKEAILIALEDIGDRRAEDAVIAILTGENQRILRLRAARALAKCGTDRSVGPIISALKEGDIEMKVACSWSLGILEAQEAEPVLRALLDHDDTDVREWSARALEGITGKRVFYKNAKGEMVLPYSLYR